MTDTTEQTVPSSAENGSAHARAAAGTGSADSQAGSARRPAAKRGSLNSLLLPELQQMATGLGISAGKMRKSDLVAALRASGHAAVISGAGPTVLVLTRDEVEVQQVRACVPPDWECERLSVDEQGARIVASA